MRLHLKDPAVSLDNDHFSSSSPSILEPRDSTSILFYGVYSSRVIPSCIHPTETPTPSRGYVFRRVNSDHNLRNRLHCSSTVAGRNFTFRFISVISMLSSLTVFIIFIAFTINKSNDIPSFTACGNTSFTICGGRVGSSFSVILREILRR